MPAPGSPRLDDRAAIGRYLAQRPEPAFFVSRFVDYSGDDGLFRKYRIAFVDRRPYACHMAIADRWDIWYLNAGMASSESKRLEEADFMRSFDHDFAARHQRALAALAERVGLDYFTVDCAENQPRRTADIRSRQYRGRAQHGFADVFPYKPPQMTRIFEAFAAMLYRRARGGRDHVVTEAGC